MLLLPGPYRLRLRLERDGAARWLPGLLQASVYAWPRLVARCYPALGPTGREIVLDFDIPQTTDTRRFSGPQSLELRVTSIGAAAGLFTRALLARRTQQTLPA